MKATDNWPAVASVLNRLLRILCRSLPMYLQDAKPWTNGNQGRARNALARLVADQRMLAGRVAQANVEFGGQPAPAPFPTEFSSLNDVAFDFCSIKSSNVCAATLTRSSVAFFS
jgi:hypothetical protein